MWNKILIATGIAAVMSFTAAYAAEFADTKNHWSNEYISVLSERGTVSGMEDGMFHPDKSVTTEQFITMVIRSCRGDIAPTDETWASGYLDYAQFRGIIEDYDILNRSNPIERRAAARIMHTALLSEYDEADEADWQCAEKLADLYDCHTCVNHIAQMYAKGIMTGREKTFFDNYGTLTRAEAAAVIVRMTDKEKRVIPDKSEQTQTKQITPETAFNIIDALIIDVRSAEEYNAGHINGSVNIPLDELVKNPYSADENKNRLIILYCSKGYKSSTAAKILVEAGYTNVCSIPGVEQYEYKLVR